MKLFPVTRTGFEKHWHPARIIKDRVSWPPAFPPLKYIPDDSDHWQLPGETRVKGGGDCEDLAIAWLHFRFTYGEKPPRLHLIVGKVPDGFHAVGMQGMADNISTASNTYYECRARRPETHIIAHDFTPWFLLSLDGSKYMIGRDRG